MTAFDPPSPVRVESEDEEIQTAIPETRTEIDRLRAELKRAAAAEARLALALESSGIGVWDWDIASDSFWMSPGALDMQGYDNVEFDRLDDAERYFVDPDSWAAWRSGLIACVRGEQELVQSDHLMRHKDGSHVWIQERARVVARGPDGRAQRIIGTRADITLQRRSQERLRWLAQHDALTGLWNRALFEDRLAAALHEAREAGGSCGLLFVDVDRFKQVNDENGHEYGDGLLRAVAGRLTEGFPASATVARIGGDEFGVVVPELESREDLATLADRAAALDVNVGLSVGAALFPDDGEAPRDLRIAADTALYEAKGRGRGQAVIFDAETMS
jgi:diguanylate cyclase (GGDEF)-like protein/PAS domain S-box-containing protein